MIYQPPTPNLGGCRCFLFNKLASFNTPQANYKLNCSLLRAISYIIRKNLTIYQPPTPNLGGCRCFLFNKLASFNTPQANYKLNCSLLRAISYVIKKKGEDSFYVSPPCFFAVFI